MANEIFSISSPEGEIVLNQPDENTRLEVRVDAETVWLTQQQIADLFGKKQPAISKHINNIYREGELQKDGTYSILEYMGNDGKQSYTVKYYNLDMILSIGYRCSGQRATHFRQWASTVLKQYLLKGYAINKQLIALQQHVDDRLLRIEDRLQQNEEQVAFLVHTHQQPQEELFATGCMWDAYSFITNLIRSAKEQVILIDNYCNDKTLTLLDQRAEAVNAIVHTTYNKTFNDALEAHNSQQSGIHSIQLPHKIHDRFLIIDQQVYLLGNSLKDMGHTLSAAILTGFTPDEVLSKLK